MVGGESPPVGYIKTTIEYDGSSWTLGNDSSRPGGFVSTGAGILTAGWIAGGYTNAPPAGNQANTEHYNGTTWTEVADLSAAKVDGNTLGTTTAGLFSGGGDPATADSEEWNGSSWTEGNNMNSARKRSCGMNVGTQTAGACIGGDLGPAQTAKVENYNGTSWTEVTDMNTARQMGGAFGTTSAFAVAGGSYPAITTTEIWDGSSFSTGNSMAQARSYQPASGNSSTSGLYGGGAHPGSSANLLSTEEWTYTAAPGPAAEYTDAIVGDMYYNTTSGSFKAIQAGVGAWAAGGAMPTATNNMASFGTQTAAMSAGGYNPPGLTANSFTYDGTSWSPIQALQVSPVRYSRRGCGTTTAGLVFGGIPPVSTATEEWDGSSWTAGGAMSTARYNLGSAGTQTAGLAMGGNQDPPPVSAAGEEYNGSSWTAGGSLNTARNGLGGVGIQTLALAIGGSTGTDSALVESYNGTAWTEISDLNTARNNLAAAKNGVAGTALAFGGHDTAATGKSESYDGTSWTEIADLATARGDLGGAGTSTDGIAYGGEEPSRSTAVEEYSVPAFSIKTVTTS
jgi:hypothetical protein